MGAGSAVNRRRLALALCCLLLAPALPAEAQDHRQKRVLVLTALRKDSPAPAAIDRDFQRLLGEGLAGELDYYSESIDVARFGEEDYQLALRDFLARKYSGRPFDLVIPISEACLTFVEKHREVLFSGTPVVFIAAPSHARPANSTGVFMGLELGGTIALAQRLQPDARQVFVVTGTSENDSFYERVARSQFDAFKQNLEFTYLSGLRMEDLERRLAALPPRSIVYYLPFTRDGAGRNFVPSEGLDRVAAAASAPVYSFMEVWMERGLVGGSLLSLTRPVGSAADLALRVLRGERADDIAPVEIDPNINQVDWRQLRRWGISESRVPVGTNIRFREPSAWDRYKYYIVGATSLLVVQMALIAGLLLHRGKRRRAEEGVRSSQAELRGSYARIRDLAARLITAQEVERMRIARELHDDVGQQLALLSIELDQLGNSVRDSESSIVARAREASDRTAAISTSVHDLSHQLHPPKLELMGLVVAVAGLRRELAQQHGIAIDFSHAGVPDTVPRDISLCLFRIVQEGLRNAIKHSGAREVSVRLAADGDGLFLSIADCGVGFDSTSGQRGLGLLSMRERLEPLRGTLTIRSSPGAGTQIDVRVPLDRPSANA
jgi:signal transduction histidine kinase